MQAALWLFTSSVPFTVFHWNLPCDQRLTLSVPSTYSVCKFWLLTDVRPFELQHWQGWTLWRFLNECNFPVMGSITRCYIRNYYLLCQCIKSAVTSGHHLNNQSRFQGRNNSDNLRTENLGYTSKINGARIWVCPHSGARFWPITTNTFLEMLGIEHDSCVQLEHTALKGFGFLDFREGKKF